MRNKISILVMVFVMLFSLPVWAGTPGFGNGDQTQTGTELQDTDQTRLRDMDQTGQVRETLINDQEARDRERLQLRDRLQISDSARIRQQERQQSLNQTEAGFFSDVQQHWAREQIASAYKWGFINGYQNDIFHPNGAISGAEGIVMISRMMNSTNNTEEAIDMNDDINWNAVPVWARETIREKTALKIAAQSQVYGEEQLNRLQYTVMLAKALKLEPTAGSGEHMMFLDQENIPADDLGYINTLGLLGVIEGSDGNFNPYKQVSRAEAASMLMRVVEIME